MLVEDSADDAELIFEALLRDGLDPVIKRVEDDAGLSAALGTESWDLVISEYALPGTAACPRWPWCVLTIRTALHPRLRRAGR